MKNGKYHIIHVGSLGFPYTFNASTNRCKAIYTVLSFNKFELLVVNNRSISKNNLISFETKREGTYNEIRFIFTSPNVLKPEGFIKRRFNNLMGRINEISLLISKAYRKEINLLFFYPTGSFLDLVIYKLYSKMFKIPIVIHYVEFRSGFKTRKSFLKLNDYLFDRYITSFCEAVIPISEFLVKKIREESEKIPVLKIPPIIDFEKFQRFEPININQKYFLFVGSAGYVKTIEFILEAFNQLTDNDYKLILVLNGLNKTITDLCTNSRKSSLIQVLTKLDDKALFNYYLNAKALLIPLANNIQDQARFPQKISEYLASKNPVITSNIGDIVFYLQDGVDALIAEPDDINSFSEKMKWVIENPDKAKAIGRSGFEKGKKYFNNRSYKNEINNFVSDIIGLKNRNFKSLT